MGGVAVCARVCARERVYVHCYMCAGTAGEGKGAADVK